MATEKNGLLDLVDEHDKAVARIGELVLERDRLQGEVTRLQALVNGLPCCGNCDARKVRDAAIAHIKEAAQTHEVTHDHETAVLFECLVMSLEDAIDRATGVSHG